MGSKPPSAPKPPPPILASNLDASAKAEDEKRRKRGATGFSSTILSAPTSPAPTGKTTLG
jgi:hypothetical protein